MLLAAALLWGSATVQAADPDPVDLVRRSIVTDRVNGAKASQYAYREYRVNLSFDRDGKTTQKRTETWEVIGLEGSTYRKLIQKNDQPLPPKDQQREDERLRKEAERRRRENPDERKRRLFSYHVTFAYDRMADLYDLRYVGQEAVSGRPTDVVEGTPKAAFQPKTGDEKEALNYKVKVWLAQPDCAVARIEREVIGDRSRMQKGTLFRMEFSPHDEGVWLIDTLVFRFSVRFYKMISGRGEETVTFSDYHRFQVDSRLVAN